MKRLLSYRMANLQGQGKRDYQEDSFAFANALDVTLMKKHGLMAMVADGMGGMEGGKKASELAVKTILNDFKEMDVNSNLGTQLARSARHASDEVNAIINGRGGCTLVAGIFYNEMFNFVSVGDSYIFLLRKGELIQLNHEHNKKNEVYLDTIRDGVVDPSDGREHYEAAALTQFIGMNGLDEIDMTRMPIPLKDGDTLVLCSDGVGGVLKEDEIISCLTGKVAGDAVLAMDGLIKVRNLKHQDNYTALVIQCNY